MKKIWEWLNGNKTLLGTLILVLLQQGIIPDHTFAYEFFLWLGGLLAGGGVVHKLVKGVNNT